MTAAANTLQTNVSGLAPYKVSVQCQWLPSPFPIPSIVYHSGSICWPSILKKIFDAKGASINYMRVIFGILQPLPPSLRYYLQSAHAQLYTQCAKWLHFKLVGMKHFAHRLVIESPTFEVGVAKKLFNFLFKIIICIYNNYYY